MNIFLTPELEQMVKEKVESGQYPSADDVVREGLRLLREQDQLREADLPALRERVQAGFSQIEEGSYVEYGSSDEFSRRFKAAARERYANESGDR